MSQTRSGYDPRMIPVPRAAQGPERGARPTGGSVHGPFGELAVSDLRHPSEPSRFALALVAMSVPVAVALFVMVSLGQAAALIGIILAIIVTLLLIWVAVQVWRIRLLGDAVLVSAQTLPAVQGVLDSVRERLGYTRRIDLFVVDKISRVLSGDSAPITLTSFFGVHVLVAEGDALGDLSDAKERQQLLFTLATYVGALKARYAQWWSPLFTAFQMTGLGRFAAPFVLPYYRATVYSGDRIAYACCGDLDVSLQAVYRALVGKDVATHLRAEGFTGQALAARRRPLLRFAQLLRATPHATNRYLNLLAFVQQRTPVEFEAHRPSLGAAAAQAEPVLRGIGSKRTSPGVVTVGVCLAVAILGGGLILGLGNRDSALAGGIADTFDDGNGDGQGPAPDGNPEDPGTVAPSAEELLLLGLLPADVQGSCTGVGSETTVAPLAAVGCGLPGNQPEAIYLYLYESPTAMGAAFDQLAAGVPPGRCSTGVDGRSTWQFDGVTQGPLACYLSTSGPTTMVWGSTSSAVVAVAQDPSWSLAAMYEWWADEGPDIR